MTEQSAFLTALQAFAISLTSTFAQRMLAFQPEDQLKGEVLVGALFTSAELTMPSDAERRGPAAPSANDLPLFAAAGIEITDDEDSDEE